MTVVEAAQALITAIEQEPKSAYGVAPQDHPNWERKVLKPALDNLRSALTQHPAQQRGEAAVEIEQAAHEWLRERAPADLSVITAFKDGAKWAKTSTE